VPDRPHLGDAAPPLGQPCRAVRTCLGFPWTLICRRCSSPPSTSASLIACSTSITTLPPRLCPASRDTRAPFSAISRCISRMTSPAAARTVCGAGNPGTPAVSPWFRRSGNTIRHVLPVSSAAICASCRAKVRRFLPCGGGGGEEGKGRSSAAPHGFPHESVRRECVSSGSESLARTVPCPGRPPRTPTLGNPSPAHLSQEPVQDHAVERGGLHRGKPRGRRRCLHLERCKIPRGARGKPATLKCPTHLQGSGPWR